VTRLTVLGGLGLSVDGVPYVGPAAQRRRLLLLAVLAIAGRRGMSRDKLLGFLWPDAGVEQGRQALYQALHVIRRAFGADAIVGGATALQLGTDAVSSDLIEFADALAARAYERAVADYAGPLLDGLSFDGSAELDRWVSVERARLAGEYVAALERLAVAAAARRDYSGAVQWWRRRAAAEPLSTAAAVGLIEALVAAGDRGAALQAALVHESLVRVELETEPDDAVRSWVARLKGGREPPPVATPVAMPVSGARPGIAAERVREQLARTLAGQYVVDRRLTVGSVTATYAATEARGGSPVHLHVIHPHVAAHVSADHFVRTVRRAIGVDDARLLRLLDVGADDDVVFYVTAPPSGPTIRDRLAADGALAIDEVVRVSRAIALALAALHRQGLAHGDLRPKHVHLMAPDAVVAGHAVPQALFAPSADGPSATDTAVTIGAPAYMSPEQLADGARPNARSDVYSFGCLVYEMLTGEPPFGGGGGSAAAARKLTQPAPSPRQVRDRVPDALDLVVRTCLARIPADRYGSADDLVAALLAVPD
jgi:DNA-binding SARP family transcriptional activator